MRNLILVTALAVAGGVGAVELGDMPADWTEAKNWLVPWTDGKRVVVRDFKGNDLLELARNHLAYPCVNEEKDNYWTLRTPVKDAVQLDPQIVRVDWRTDNADVKEAYTLVVSEGGPRLRLETRVVLKAGAKKFGTGATPGALCRNVICLKPVGKAALGKAFCRGGVWTKPERGESYEAGGATLVPYEAPEGGLFLWYDSIGAFRRRPYEEFCIKYRSTDPAEALRDAKLTAENARGVIMPATGEYYERVQGSAKADAPDPETPAAGDGERAYSNVINMYLLPWKDSAFVAAALQTDAALAATITTDRDFNLFDSSKENATFCVAMMNPKNATNEVSCRVVARNYDGKADVDETFKVKLAPYGITSRRFPLPKRLRDYWFVNAEFDDGRTNSFVRADVATIEPYRFKSLDTSIMGLAANFNIPSEEACDRLLTRMGARWIRSSGGFETEKYAEKNRLGILSFHLDQKATNETLRLAFATKKLEEAAARDCPIVEIGNELNFGARGDEVTRRIAYYKEWLKAFYDARAALKLEKTVKISTFGFAGCVDGGSFYNAMDKAGCWQYCDILSLHPGRLNQTPDNPGADWQWNYRAQIRTTKGFIARMRKKGHPLELILTEVYARTPPNMNDSDSTRSAAENLILSCMLAKVEGVTALNWYQMHDSVHSNIGGINERNKEYHYGLLRRDGTVKPSLLAFCTISEALDGAEFDREVNYDDDRKAWVFKTPRGEMAILYDRKDGYYPYDGMFTGRPFTGHLEPWLDHWKSHTEYAFTAPKGFVVVRDAIGRTRKIKADKKGHVTLTLSGAPLIVYGLGASVPMEGASRPMTDWGLVSAEGATAGEIAAFRKMGGGFFFDAHPGEGFDEYVYIDEKICRSLPAEGGHALEDLQSLYERGVRRLVVPMTVTPQGADWAAKQENAKAQGREWAERLAPYAAARAAHPSTTPEIWVLPSGDWGGVLFNGVREKVSGLAILWENFPWSEPRKRLGDLLWKTKWANLPVMVLNFGPVGFNVFKDKGRETELGDAQFFGSLFLLSTRPECRAVAFTNLRDGSESESAVGTTPLAATITDKVGRYCKVSGFFGRDGSEKSRLKTAAFVRKLTEAVSGLECSVSRSGLRTLRFWNGNVPCAIVWQGDRNCIYGWRIDDLSGRPEAKESAIEVDVEKGGRVCDIYGREKNVRVRKNRVELMVGDVPIVVCGVRGIVESSDEVSSRGKECASPARGQ